MCDVLVLEDDPLVRTVMVEALADAGFSVIEASSLQEARAALAANAFCRVLMVDHDLGEADKANGFDFARDRVASSVDVSALYVTGRWHLLEDMVPSARERQLRKPFRLVELVQSVRDLLEGSVNRRSALVAGAVRTPARDDGANGCDAFPERPIELAPVPFAEEAR